jgi:hypothetical protein
MRSPIKIHFPITLTQTRCRTDPVIPSMQPDPLLLTLAFDYLSQQLFEEQQRQHFPFVRNPMAPHLTLFGHLPGEAVNIIRSTVERYALGVAPFEIRVTDLVLSDGSVAYRLESQLVKEMRDHFTLIWLRSLKPEDRTRLALRVVIQDDVPHATAKLAYDEMLLRFEPFAIKAVGFTLWRKSKRADWEVVRQMPFGR